MLDIEPDKREIQQNFIQFSLQFQANIYLKFIRFLGLDVYSKE